MNCVNKKGIQKVNDLHIHRNIISNNLVLKKTVQWKQNSMTWTVEKMMELISGHLASPVSL